MNVQNKRFNSTGRTQCELHILFLQDPVQIKPITQGKKKINQENIQHLTQSGQFVVQTFTWLTGQQKNKVGNKCINYCNTKQAIKYLYVHCRQLTTIFQVEFACILKCSLLSTGHCLLHKRSLQMNLRQHYSWVQLENLMKYNITVCLCVTLEDMWRDQHAV